MRNKVVILVVCSILLVLAESSIYASEKHLDSLFYVVERAWEKRDGGSVAIVHTAMVELIIIAPEETLKWLRKEVEIKNELMAKWQYTVFTDHSGTKKGELNKLRADLINSIEKCRFKDDDTNKLKKEMLNALNSISIRKID